MDLDEISTLLDIVLKAAAAGPAYHWHGDQAHIRLKEIKKQKIAELEAEIRAQAEAEQEAERLAQLTELKPEPEPEDVPEAEVRSFRR